jgi:hypothetical protein
MGPSPEIKYPPAEPEALGIVPLEAAAGGAGDTSTMPRLMAHLNIARIAAKTRLAGADSQRCARTGAPCQSAGKKLTLDRRAKLEADWQHSRTNARITLCVHVRFAESTGLARR